mmetsp:Transcript_8079/g.16743  ORF Transcript_8079/g.16743 Transcript_8079/m.16743 type:complete len:203 (+) Transcript_8079:1475-2083(+)
MRGASLLAGSRLHQLDIDFVRGKILVDGTLLELVLGVFEVVDLHLVGLVDLSPEDDLPAARRRHPEECLVVDDPPPGLPLGRFDSSRRQQPSLRGSRYQERRGKNQEEGGNRCGHRREGRRSSERAMQHGVLCLWAVCVCLFVCLYRACAKQRIHFLLLLLFSKPFSDSMGKRERAATLDVFDGLANNNNTIILYTCDVTQR